jgi:hypothetical protein
LSCLYQQLDRLQGDAVPMYLSNIDLVMGNYLDLVVDIVHMLLMSRGGASVNEIGGADALFTLVKWCAVQGRVPCYATQL